MTDELKQELAQIRARLDEIDGNEHSEFVVFGDFDDKCAIGRRNHFSKNLWKIYKPYNKSLAIEDQI